MGRTQYQYTVQDADLGELRVWAPRVLDAMKKLPQLKDVVSDQQNSGLELQVTIDRDTASRLGSTAFTSRARAEQRFPCARSLRRIWTRCRSPSITTGSSPP
jgi:hypothetical protein